MEQKTMTLLLFLLIGILLLTNLYTMYQLNWAIEMISLLGENLRK